MGNLHSAFTRFMADLQKMRDPVQRPRFRVWQRVSRWHYLPCVLAFSFGVTVSVMLFQILRQQAGHSVTLAPLLGIILSLVGTAVLTGFLLIPHAAPAKWSSWSVSEL